MTCKSMLAVAALVGISSVTYSHATVRLVPTNYATVQLAVSASAAGDTVLVAAGVYVEAISVGIPLTIMSESGADVTRLQGDGDLIWFNSVQSDTIKVIGFELVSTLGRCIASNFSKFRVENCIFRHARQAAIHFSGQSANIVGNRFLETSATHEAGWDCIRSDNFGKTRLVRNIFYGLSYPSVFSTTSEEVFILNNTVVDCDGGFDVDNGTPGILHNNLFDQITGAAVWTSFAGPSVDYNLFNDCGIDVTGGTPGIHSVFLPPMLIDPAAGNFTPLAGSPVIDAGDPAYLDPDSSISDIGAIPAVVSIPSATEFAIVGENRFRVVSPTPTFTWTYVDTIGPQVEYELEVGTDMDWTVAEMWDTGPVVSGANSVVYAGFPLADGQTYHVRISVNNGVEWGAWTFGIFRMNSAPTTPVIIQPHSGAQTARLATTFTVSNATDGDGDTKTYEIEVYNDPGLTDTAYWATAIAETPFTTSHGPLALPEGVDKWWRCRSYDGFEYSAWSSIEYFLAMPPITRHVPGDYATIQAAINAAGPADTILVAAGTFTENLDFLGKSINVISESGPAVTTIRPANLQVDIIKISASASCLIEGFTIRDVNYFSAVGINCSNCGLTIRNNLFTNNTEAAVWIHNDGQVLAMGNEFVANASAGDAATLLCRGYRRAVVIGNVFRDNVSNWNGGGLHFSQGDYAEARRNLILRNGQSTDIGGGIYAATLDTAVFVNNTIDSNHAQVGGGIFLSQIGRLNLQNNIVTRNFAYGIHADVGIAQAAQDYNNVWNNAGQDFSGASLLPGTNTISADPLFNDADSAHYGRGISFGSPCLNSGNPAEEYDDPDGSRNDMGAFPFPIALPFADRINVGSQQLDHIVSNTPRFYWTFIDTMGAQTGYEFEVGTDPDWSVAEMWSSGQVASADTSLLYAGLPLIDGASYYARLRLANGVTWGDWLPFSFRMNSKPTTPGITGPGPWDTLHFQTIRTVLANSVDAEGDAIQYEFEVYYDEELSAIADIQYVEEDSAETSSQIWQSLLPGSPYWWRARGYDGFEYSNWSSTTAFFARGPAQIRVPAMAATIMQAFESAGQYDTVRVAPGTYYANIEFLGRSLTLMSDSGATKTILNPMNASLPHISLGVPVGDDVEISGFTFQGGAGGSVISLNGGTPRIHDNMFIGFNGIPSFAMVLHVTFGAPVITRNIFYNNGGISCIGIYEGDVDVINNTFDRNRGGLHLIGGTAVVRNNIVTGSLTFGIYGNLPNADYNCVFGNLPNYEQYSGGPNDLNVSPIYYDALGGDFRLQPGSPCINAGDPAVQYNDPDGSRNDMGAIASVCGCNCHADPVCDHEVDLLDVAFVIAAAFRGLADMNDDFCFPHGETVGGRTDVDCSGSTDIVDVVRAIDVAFRGANQSTTFCSLCQWP